MMRTLGQKVLALLYPRDCVCLACGRLLVEDSARQLCADCAVKLVPIFGPRCAVCGAPVATGGLCGACARLPASARVPVTAPFVYADVAMSLVHTLKFQCVRDAARPLALGMAECMPSGFDILVPVPLHRRRERERGFNQARVLCEALRDLGAPPIVDALGRTRPTRTQSKLSAQERWKNLEGAFVLAEPVAGQRILLVDDVRTTGATLMACASVLYAAGAREVRAWTATVAVMRPEEGDSIVV